MARNVSAVEGLFFNTLIDDETRRYSNYLKGVAKNFPVGKVQCTVSKGKAADVIIESAAAEKETLIAMATHGRSGLNRFLLGSVAEKVIRGASNPLLLVKATDKTPPWDMATLRSVVVPLDGSELAESVLPSVEKLAKKLDLEVTLLGVYGVPYGVSSAGEGFYNTTQIEAFLRELRAETLPYLEQKAAELKSKGLVKVSLVAKEGLAADEIISIRAPNSRQLDRHVHPWACRCDALDAGKRDRDGCASFRQPGARPASRELIGLGNGAGDLCQGPCVSAELIERS